LTMEIMMMNGDDDGDDNDDDSSLVQMVNNDNQEAVLGSGTPPLQPDKVLETEALEELLRQETLRQIEAAWKAQRRLMQSCLMMPNKTETTMTTFSAVVDTATMDTTDTADTSATPDVTTTNAAPADAVTEIDNRVAVLAEKNDNALVEDEIMEQEEETVVIEVPAEETTVLEVPAEETAVVDLPAEETAVIDLPASEETAEVPPSPLEDDDPDTEIIANV